MNKILSRCPVCGGDLLVTKLYCMACDTTLEGHFQPTSNPFSDLSNDQVQFLLTFIRCEGKFNRMETEMNLSYPTLRKMFNEILRAMGFEPGKEEPQITRLSPDERLQILDDLAQGVITSEEAQRRLRGTK